MKCLVSILFCFFILNPVCLLQVTPIPDDIPTPEPRPPIFPEHVPVDRVPENSSVEITMKIQGARPEDIVNLNFRDKGTSDFHVLPMGLNPETKQFEATIDERYHSRYEIEYYIEIFPVGVSPIRLPPDPGTFYEVKTIRNIAQIIRAILIMFLIASPAIIAYIIGRMYKTHVKKTTVYQQKLNARKRTLARQREKHYQDYWRKMTGNRKVEKGKPLATRQSDAGPGSQDTKTAPTNEPEEFGEFVEPIGQEEGFENSDELQRELDEILSKKRDTVKTTTAPTKPASSASAKPSTPVPPKSPPQTSPRASDQPQPKSPALQPGKPPLPLKYPTRPPVSGSQPNRKTAPAKPMEPNVQPPPTQKPATKPTPASTAIPAPATPKPPIRKESPQNSKPQGSILDQSSDEIDLDTTDSKKLDKNERDRLLDILGLDL